MIVEIEPLHKVVQCEEGEGLLDVLLRENVPISYSCKIGNCGMCEVEPFDLFEAGRRQRPRLMPSRKRFLACQINVVKDIGVRLPVGRPVVNVPFQYLQASITSLCEIVPGVHRVDFDSGRKSVRFLPGQKFALSLSWGHSPLLMPANSPGKSTLSFLIDSGVQKALLEELRDKTSEGQKKIELVGPIGNAYFVRDDSVDVLVCAIGTGVIAARSIVETLAEEECTRPLKLLLDPSSASAHLVDEICDLCSSHLPQAEVMIVSDWKHALPSQQRMAGMHVDMVDFIQHNHANIKAEQAFVFAPSCALIAMKMSLIAAGFEANAVFIENADINFIEEENVDVS